MTVPTAAPDDLLRETDEDPAPAARPTETLPDRRPAPEDAVGDRVEIAPYALVRTAALDYPPDGPALARFRELTTERVQLHEALAGLAGPLSDLLHDTATTHSPDFHRQVVLPLRRAVHAVRPPARTVVDRLADLPERVPQVRQWLGLWARLDRVAADLSVLREPALAETRAQLAELCASPALTRAVALTSADLLRAVRRAAASGARPDRRGRKEEPQVVRYVLRASAKTSPWSWFTSVGWRSGTSATPDGKAAQVSPATDGGDPLTATSGPNYVLVEYLLDAILGLPDVRQTVPLRLAAGFRQDGSRVVFRRDVLMEWTGTVLGKREEEVELAFSRPLAAVARAVRTAGHRPVTGNDLVGLLARGGGTEATTKASAFVDRLLTEHLLVPCRPIDLHSGDVLSELARWCDLVSSIPSGVAPALRVVADQTAALARLDGPQRPAALEELRAAWRDVFRAIGGQAPDGPLAAEDVVAVRPVAASPPSRAHLDDLRTVAALTEVFDGAYVLRRLLRDRFVARFGPGGVCGHLEDFSGELVQALRALGSITPTGEVIGDEPVTSELRHLAELRREVHRSLRESEGELVIPNRVARSVVDALPAWLLARPASYSLFVQVDRAADLLVVNHAYEGWGRYTSRFLPRLGEEARREVAVQIRRHLPPDEAVAQFRPVNGFGANVHPLLLDWEVGEDPSWHSVLTIDVELYHDPVTDVLRLRHKPTGQPLNSLYLGFLLPYVLPDRFVMLYTDLANGPVSLAPLAAEQPMDGPAGLIGLRPRLRLGRVVVQRRSWQLDADATGALQAELQQDAEAAAARWRARLGLPEQVFARAAGGEGEIRSAEAVIRYLRAPKPQFVDLAHPLHLRSLHRWLARIPPPLSLEEALPTPTAGVGRVSEQVIETYRRGVGRSR